MEESIYDYEYEDDGEIEYADYYEDDTYIYQVDEPWGTEEDNGEKITQSLTLEELYNYCVVPTISDSHRHLIGILTWSFLFLISSRLIRLPNVLVHILSAGFGGALLWQMFDWRSSLMGGLFVITYLNLLSSHYVLKKWRGTSCFVIGVIYLIVCEFWLVNPMWWHAIRGLQMVILMKIVSIAHDLDSTKMEKLPNIFEMIGYIFCPGTIIFGPWVPYSTYVNVLTPMKWNLRWAVKISLNFLIAGFFLVFSTCFVSWMIPDHSSRWLIAYRDALSFRSSHYFVSYLSEVSANLSGLDVSSVSKPWKIEFPRSLVEVVIYWNTSMHYWLKTYVFKPARGNFGVFSAILLTYATSALFHGLNFQLGSVLLSLAFYTYTEHTLREKIAAIFDACILSRPCSNCKHRLKGSSMLCVTVNGFFGLVAAFHLAYLGMMFDSSNQIQEVGYSAMHTLRKWSALNYTSHWLALAMYVLMAVI